MGSTPRPALQLFSVRSLDRSLPDIIRLVGEAGYEGVEFAHRFREEPPGTIAAALDETGVVPVAVHADLPILEAAIEGENDLLDRCEAIGCDKLIVPHLSYGHFRTRRAVRALSDRLQVVAAELTEHDIDLGTHNVRHYLWPLLPDVVDTLLDRTPVPYLVGEYVARGANRLPVPDDGSIPRRTGLRELIDRTEREQLFFEVEVAEITAAGFDPVAAFPLFDGRAEMIHLRDVEPTGRFGGHENVPHGEGVVDVEGVIEAAREFGVEWVVYENELPGDPESKIEDGLGFLRRHLPAGRKLDEPSRSAGVTER